MKTKEDDDRGNHEGKTKCNQLHVGKDEQEERKRRRRVKQYRDAANNEDNGRVEEWRKRAKSNGR